MIQRIDGLYVFDVMDKNIKLGGGDPASIRVIFKLSTRSRSELYFKKNKAISSSSASFARVSRKQDGNPPKVLEAPPGMAPGWIPKRLQLWV